MNGTRGWKASNRIGQRDGLGGRALLKVMIELGMEVENLFGSLGVVAGSPRDGKWLVVDPATGRERRIREEDMREVEQLDESPAYLKWVEKRELL